MAKLFGLWKNAGIEMSKFENLSYVTKNGTYFPCQTKDDRYPFTLPWQAPLSLPILHWKYKSKAVELSFKSYAQPVIDPRSDLLVVVTGDDDFPKPGNAAVFNQDGSLNHVLNPPQLVQHSIGGGPLQNYFVESIESVRIQNGKLRVDLNFNNEWLDERYYDLETRAWSERISINRK